MNMEKIAIFGAGGYGRELACLLKIINKDTPTWDFVGFYDDNPQLKGSHNEYGKVLGGMKELNSVKEKLAVAIAIGNPSVVKKIVSLIDNNNLYFPNLISPNTVFLDKESVKMGRGNIICINCSFSCNIHIGDFNTFNGWINVGHDVIIGSFNSIMPDVKISGEVRIGEENFIGCAAVILQQISVGDKTTVGANSSVIKKTKNGCTYVGNPATRIKY
jgi:sugar O-acyltransferase (sialic acid O-acetyltransferase NeuD family)